MASHDGSNDTNVHPSYFSPYIPLNACRGWAIALLEINDEKKRLELD
jgi:hypothetical protein